MTRHPNFRLTVIQLVKPLVTEEINARLSQRLTGEQDAEEWDYDQGKSREACSAKHEFIEPCRRLAGREEHGSVLRGFDLPSPVSTVRYLLSVLRGSDLFVVHAARHSLLCLSIAHLRREPSSVLPMLLGKNSTDPRSNPTSEGVNIPNRPSGQCPKTAAPPENNQFHQHRFGFLGGFRGFPPVATARFGNFVLSASFGGLIPSLFNFQMYGFSDGTTAMYGAGVQIEMIRRCDSSDPIDVDSMHGES
ncbi:hypothetical protein Cgig2_010413 [Carnegiea gigantea]|uniref:Uncharacterized protein n=1 Tax=Carnegiea gigantea TaxID=171969 RepID=A0A9Q1Q5Q1_9CARY|nr:hypothetical protein Cgig2_010413 [Carnegiea gigantea]